MCKAQMQELTYINIFSHYNKTMKVTSQFLRGFKLRLKYIEQRWKKQAPRSYKVMLVLI